MEILDDDTGDSPIKYEGFTDMENISRHSLALSAFNIVGFMVLSYLYGVNNWWQIVIVALGLLFSWVAILTSFTCLNTGWLLQLLKSSNKWKSLNPYIQITRVTSVYSGSSTFFLLLYIVVHLISLLTKS